ncbi:P-loop containing nucleoside triphosphate hydrolase protein [Tilletiopsis washingtonensis]|uniref:P-loop containing nucleoside triphosphate hydrolase protein n=1 Tax=Tilletiopsis washingtonensis TaxID=58919 RepID=A0A316ZHR4_9BASI|nr:P-loop containing nucleoside triphosphate hydrolase protein [Tilletiopsis washingtonensis]PWO01301.1 P-loop containing nucleoside triphosphate hydrolase protein [Tilletiopsis washingtonensis]
MASPSTLPDAAIARRLAGVKTILLVLSGKGGVGKSSVSSQLALSLSSSAGGAARVGLLDIDLTGPSIPRMLGLDGSPVHQSSDGWVPVYADREQRLAVMSVGFLLRSRNDSVVWRGPKKNAMIKQFLGDVRWGELDYLIVDTPPGTSDEHISLVEYLAPFSPVSLMVTTPQALSLADNLRSLDFTRKVSLPLLGVIENMSGYVCPHCTECTNVWGRGGGEALAQREGLAFLGRIPIDPGLVRVLDDAKEEAQVTVAQELGVEKVSLEDITKPLPDADADADAATATASVAKASTASTTTPAGTRLSRTILQRYTASQTFPIFQEITQRVVEQLAKVRETQREAKEQREATQ